MATQSIVEYFRVVRLIEDHLPQWSRETTQRDLTQDITDLFTRASADDTHKNLAVEKTLSILLLFTEAMTDTETFSTANFHCLLTNVAALCDTPERQKTFISGAINALAKTRNYTFLGGRYSALIRHAIAFASLGGDRTRYFLERGFDLLPDAAYAAGNAGQALIDAMYQTLTPYPELKGLFVVRGLAQNPAELAKANLSVFLTLQQFLFDMDARSAFTKGMTTFSQLAKACPSAAFGTNENPIGLVSLLATRRNFIDEGILQMMPVAETAGLLALENFQCELFRACNGDKDKLDRVMTASIQLLPELASCSPQGGCIESILSHMDRYLGIFTGYLPKEKPALARTMAENEGIMPPSDRFHTLRKFARVAVKTHPALAAKDAKAAAALLKMIQTAAANDPVSTNVLQTLGAQRPRERMSRRRRNECRS